MPETEIGGLTLYLTLAMVLLMLVQAVGLVYALLRVNTLLRRSEKVMEDRFLSVQNQLRTLSTSLESLAGVTARIPELAAKTCTALDSTAEYLVRADESTAKALQKASQAVEESGRRVDLAIARFSRHTGQVVKGIETPAHQASAFLKGVRTGFRVWREQRTGIPTQDEDRFI